MKRFKEFAEKTFEPILITAVPSHGKHSNYVSKHLKEEEDLEHVKSWVKTNENQHIAHHPVLASLSNKMVGEKLAESQPHFHRDHPNYDAVKNYTRMSHKLNRYHIEKASGKDITDDHKIAHFEDQTKHLDKVIRSHKLPDDVHLYHGTSGWHPGDEAAKHPKGHIRMPAYLSTSHNKAISKGFCESGPRTTDSTHHIIHIHAKKGQKALYIGNRTVGEEHETLLPRNQVLKVHPKPTVLSDGTHVWHSKIVSQKANG